MKLDKNNPLPLYLQAKEILKEKIGSEWKPGGKIPTENELANQLNVSNITIKRAVIDLVNEGLLYRHRGKGTFVVSTLPEKDIYKSVFFSTDEKETTHKLLEYQFEKADSSIAKWLEINDEDPVIRMMRLGIEDDEPVSIEYTFLPQHLLNNGPLKGIESELIYTILKETLNLELTTAKNYFSGTVATKSYANLLNIPPNTPLFVWERITYAKPNMVVEYSKFIMRQDKEKYFLEVKL